MISLVALLREPAMLDPAVIATVASRAWNVDLGHGEIEGADGRVLGVPLLNMILVGDRAYIVNNVPAPYVKDPQAVAETIGDLRVRALFAQHTAWWSCDALGIEGNTSPAEVEAEYRRLARFVAELLDDNCLLIYLPDSQQAYAINDDTHRALLADDPLAVLDATRELPVVEIGPDDPEMQAAVAQAQESWHRFVAAFEDREGEAFSVKAPITYSDTTEFIWLSVSALEGDQIFGTLGNDPADLGPLKFGSKVVVPLADLNDWCYIDSQGELQGGFTIEVVRKAMRGK